MKDLFQKVGSKLSRAARTLFLSSGPSPGQTHPLHHVKDFAIYYGQANEPALAMLRKKHLVIIEPLHYSRQQIAALQAAGTLAFGYLSVMEAPAWHEARMAALVPEDFLYRPHRDKIHFPQWDSYLMDLREPHYRELLLAEIQSAVLDKGLDGIFLDTVGDIDDYIQEPSAVQQMRQAYQQLLRAVRDAFPNLLLMQNRGFDSLDYSAAWIQGLLWEDWRGGWRKDLWTKLRVERLLAEQRRGLVIFSVSLGADNAPAKEARQLGFIHTHQPEGYSQLKDEPE